MNRRHWTTTALVFVGVSLMVGGGFMFSTYGWGQMGGSYGMACDTDELFGSSASVEGISPAVAESSASQYLERYGRGNLEIAEIMEFQRNFYVQVREKKTGRFAFEFLIDRGTGRAYPEPGPNMMWDTKYGRMSWLPWVRTSEEMRISPEEAINIAQNYLDRNSSGITVEPQADEFYGYYTIHTMRDGAITGMLSVNGEMGAVWPHTWHGEFIGMLGGNNEDN